MAAVAITRTELDSAGLRAAAAGSSDAKQARRLLALAMVLDGHPRLMAAQAGVVPGTLVHTNEYSIYARLPAWGYRHQTVCHGRGE